METMTRKKRRPMSEINVVPYIDVMLVLLIVFMVTAPMLNQGIEVDLPQANNEPLDLDENLESLIVSITAAGDYFLIWSYEHDCCWKSCRVCCYRSQKTI